MIIPTKNKQEGKNMIGMFWAEKYAMATGLTLVIRKMFGYRGTKDMWVSALTAGTALVSMNLGAGLLYPYSAKQYILSAPCKLEAFIITVLKAVFIKNKADYKAFFTFVIRYKTLCKSD